MAILYGNPSQEELVAGMDAIVNNTRTRAPGQSAPLAALYGTPGATQGVNWMDGSGATISTTATTSMTLTAAQLGTGLVTIAPTNATTVTFDTAANIWTYFTNNSSGPQANLPYTLNGTVSTTTTVGDSMACLIVNGSATNTITLAAGTNGAFDTNQANSTIPGATSRYVFIQLALVSGVQHYFIYF